MEVTGPPTCEGQPKATPWPSRGGGRALPSVAPGRQTDRGQALGVDGGVVAGWPRPLLPGVVRLWVERGSPLHEQISRVAPGRFPSPGRGEFHAIDEGWVER